MSRDDVQRWKDKYLENIEQQERLQRRWDARIDLLRRGLVRSSLAAEGSDKAVDQCMKELREILRRDDMDAGLSGLIPRLEKAVLDSEQRRQQRTQQNIDALGELAQQLLALDLPRELRKPLKQFARDIEERARQSREIPILLSELSRLQRQALAERKGGDAEDGRPSLLQRLFGGKESETTAEPSASVPSVGGRAVPAGRRARRGARRSAAAVARPHGRRHRKRASGLGRGRRAWRAEPDPAG